MGHYFDNGHFWSMHWIWWIIIIVIVLSLLFFMTWSNRQNRKKDETPLEILKRKYASGKITTEEYKERKRILEEAED